jgi:L-amino acid N-acyltransferase YncA
MSNLNYMLCLFENIRLSLKKLNVVRGDRAYQNSTMFTWTHFPEMIKDIPPLLVAVCCDGDNIIGWSGVGTIGKMNGFGNLSTYVSSQYRGQGIATSLIKIAVGNYSRQNPKRRAIVLQMESNFDEIKKIIEDFGFETLPLIEDKYDYVKDQILDIKESRLLDYHKYLTLAMDSCGCVHCLKRQSNVILMV